MRRLIVGSIAIGVCACHGEHTGTISGPPLTVALATPTSTSTPLPPPAAEFQRLVPDGVDLPFATCREVLVSLATGRATVSGDELNPGDVLVVRGLPEPNGRLSGQGLAVVVMAQDPDCIVRTRVVRAIQAPELTFSHGAMHAHLDIDEPNVASFYLGRLSGTAGVPEHSHDQSWEVLCAVEASGTFTLRGVETHLGPRTCVSVEPGAKHSWKPDPGSNLVAVQMYSPPGPEQRFKKFATDDRARDP